MADVYTVMWKEMKTLLETGNSRGKLWPLIFIAVFGVAMPLQIGPEWLRTPASVAFWVVIPLVVVSSWVADSFAGERERHTLESLLATRLSDRAILFGKIASGVGYAWGMTLVAMLLGLVAVNAAHWHGTVMLYSPEVAAASIGLSFLTATIAANLGTLVSLRAATVRQAQQTVSLGMMVVIWIPILGVNLLPSDLKRSLLAALESGDLMQFAVGAVAVLVVVDALLLAAAVARFQRTRLILD